MVWMLAFNDLIGDRQLDLVTSHYGFRPVASSDDVKVDAVYLYRRGGKCTMVTLEAMTNGREYALVEIENPDNRVVITGERLIALSQRRRIVLLLKRSPSKNESR